MLPVHAQKNFNNIPVSKKFWKTILWREKWGLCGFGGTFFFSTFFFLWLHTIVLASKIKPEVLRLSDDLDYVQKSFNSGLSGPSPNLA